MTGISDIVIEGIKATKELAIHVVDSETLTAGGKVNILVVIGFLIYIFVRRDGQMDIPVMVYILIVIGMISCMISSKSLSSKRSKENRLQ